MKTPPANLEIETIASALSAQWNRDASVLTYAPLGYGSHHWIAETSADTRWFITVDALGSAYLAPCEDGAFEVLGTAFQAAAALRDVANLTFVNAPIADQDGRWIRRLDQRYAMAVFPYLEVDPTEFDSFPRAEDRDDALRLVSEIHNATALLSTGGLRAESFLVPNRDSLLQALGELDAPWLGGPYSEPSRRLLRDHAAALGRRIDRFDRLSALVLEDKSSWVVTHGEPHAGNVIRTQSGAMAVVDWTAVAYAPRERDIWMLLDEANPDWSAYAAATGINGLSEQALAAYRLKWNLSDIAVCLSRCRGPHDQSEDMAAAWAVLEAYVNEVAFSLCRAG